jgi:hypothetical protein
VAETSRDPTRAAGGESQPARERSSLDDVIDAYGANVDLTLVRESLRRTPEERLRRMMELQRFARELREAGARARQR